MPPLLFFEPKVGKGYAYDPVSGGVFELEPDEFEVLVRRDPPGAYKHLIEEMHSYSGPRRRVEEFIAHLSSIGITHDRLSFPARVYFELTSACNLRCSHCYLSAGEPRSDELSFERWSSLVEGVSSYAVQVVLTGGEPFVFPGIVDLIVSIKNHGLSLRILTNGTLLSEFLPQISGVLNPRTDSFQVSLDGTKDVNDSIRGEGSFDRAVRGIRAAVSAGIPVDVAVTVLPPNRDSVLDLYRYASSLGIRSFRVSPGIAMGRLERGVSRSSFLDLLEHLKQESASLGVPVSYEPQSELPVVPESVYTCPAGVSQALITSTGDVIPCPIFRFPEFVMGNVSSESLLSIWRKGDWSKLKRNLSGTKCASCPLFLSCRGGCPARAYLEYGTLNAPAPDCRWPDKD